jgi:hypothetical protein
MAACGGKNAKGKPCGMPALTGSKRCWQHTGGKVAKLRKEAASRGGKSHGSQAIRRARPPSVPIQVTSQADVAATASRLIKDVWAGEMDPRSANAITGALHILLRPGLLAPTGAYADFFDQFKDVEMVITRDGSAGDGSNDEDSGSSCFGVMENGTRVLLTGDLALAAWQRLRNNDDLGGIEWVGGPNVEPEMVDIKIKRPRNPTVPPPEETH